MIGWTKINCVMCAGVCFLSSLVLLSLLISTILKCYEITDLFLYLRCSPLLQARSKNKDLERANVIDKYFIFEVCLKAKLILKNSTGKRTKEKVNG